MHGIVWAKVKSNLNTVVTFWATFKFSIWSLWTRDSQTLSILDRHFSANSRHEFATDFRAFWIICYFNLIPFKLKLVRLG